MKIFILISIIFVIFDYYIIKKRYNLKINENYLKIKNKLNITLNKNLKDKLRIGIYTYGIKNGGRARITSILLNYFNQINIFNTFLFTNVKKENKEYYIPKNIKRDIIKNNIIKMIIKYKIDILIYELSNYNEIKILNKYKYIQIIFYQHSSIFHEFYSNFTLFLKIYKEYQESNYVISLVSLENNYLFKKWNINSILMNNFITYEYNSIIPSDLTTKTILMLGRAKSKNKRFELGIQAMEYIVQEINEVKMKIISILNGTNHLQNLIFNIKLEKNIKFIGYSLTPEIFFKNSSLHIFPTISESFGLVLSETKIFGIPNILLGLDYVSLSKGGNVIIYDDSPESIAKESIKILYDGKYRKKLGKNAKQSMKKFNNKKLLNKWIKLIVSIYNNELYYKILRKNEKEMNENIAKNILTNQINLIKKRNINLKNIDFNDFKNFNNFYNFQHKII